MRFSFGNPLGFMGAMTIGYSVGAALLWTAGLVSTNEFIVGRSDSVWGPDLLSALVVPGAIAWTLVIAAYLVWTSLRRADEERLLAALDDAYRLPAPTAPGPQPAPAGMTAPATSPVPEPAAAPWPAPLPEPAAAPGPGRAPEPASQEPTL